MTPATHNFAQPSAERHAEHTPGTDEISLHFWHTDGKEAGTRGLLFYSGADYALRQADHGLTTYPVPTHA